MSVAASCHKYHIFRGSLTHNSLAGVESSCATILLLRIFRASDCLHGLFYGVRVLGDTQRRRHGDEFEQPSLTPESLEPSNHPTEEKITFREDFYLPATNKPQALFHVAIIMADSNKRFARKNVFRCCCSSPGRCVWRSQCWMIRSSTSVIRHFVASDRLCVSPSCVGTPDSRLSAMLLSK